MKLLNGPASAFVAAFVWEVLGSNGYCVWELGKRVHMTALAQAVRKRADSDKEFKPCEAEAFLLQHHDVFTRELAELRNKLSRLLVEDLILRTNLLGHYTVLSKALGGLPEEQRKYYHLGRAVIKLDLAQNPEQTVALYNMMMGLLNEIGSSSP